MSKRTKRLGFTLKTSPADADGLVAYAIHAPDGTVYAAGHRRGDEKTVAQHYQRSVRRLNANAGLASIKWQPKTLNDGTPTQHHDWKRPIKESAA